DGNPSSIGISFAILVIMGASTLSALSGVGKGIKWLSNINMVLSIFLLGFLIIFGSTFFGTKAFFLGIWDYLIALPRLSFEVFRPDGTETGDALAGWQGAWSVFYWAWWVAFAPFVGVFLARISKGRSVREFVLGAMIVPAIMCFVWFAWAGGTAIDLELSGVADGAINGATDGDKIFAMTSILLGGKVLAWMMSVLIVVLLMTYLVTSADSAVLIVNTINAAGDEGPKARPHILFWGAALGAVVAALLLVGGISAIQTALVIGALPFSVVMVLMCVSLLKAIYRDGQREKAGVASTVANTPAE
ncbi:MAG: BCCT family transporter, partial [Pseudomonadota bacterium]